MVQPSLLVGDAKKYGKGSESLISYYKELTVAIPPRVDKPCRDRCVAPILCADICGAPQPRGSPAKWLSSTGEESHAIHVWREGVNAGLQRRYWHWWSSKYANQKSKPPCWKALGGVVSARTAPHCAHRVWGPGRIFLIYGLPENPRG